MSNEHSNKLSWLDAVTMLLMTWSSVPEKPPLFYETECSANGQDDDRRE
jgi:hypothetical protein